MLNPTLTQAATPPPSTKPNTSWWQGIKDNLNKGYQGILEYVKNPFSGLSTYLKKGNNPDKSELDALRQKHFDLIAEEAKKANPDYNAVTKQITKDTKRYLQKIIKQEEEKLGKAPCKYTIVTLGSLARQETGPITDLEIAILPEKKDIETWKYFYQLTQNISDRLFLLGEHPDIGGKGLRMDEADNAPPHLRFFARNATPEQAKALLQQAIYNKHWDKIPYEGSRPFLATPEEFAEYSRENFTQDRAVLRKQKEQAFEREWAKAKKDPKNKKKLKTKDGQQELRNEIYFWLDQMYKPFSPRELKTANDAGKSLGRNTDRLCGDVPLFNKFKAKKNKILEAKNKGKELKSIIAKEKMVADINGIYQKGKSVFLTGELGKTLDLKRELYRFVEQFLTNLGFSHHCKTQNSIDIANELIGRGILSPEFGKKVIDFMQFATGLKLKEQSILKRQGFAAYFDQDEFNSDKEDLEKEIKNLKASLEYLKKATPDSADVAVKERELVKLEHKLEHLLEMAPGKIYSEEDVSRLKAMLPVAKEIFGEAVAWTQGKEKLGFDGKPVLAANPEPAPLPLATTQPKPLLFQANNPAPKAAEQVVAPTPAISIMEYLKKMFVG